MVQSDKIEEIETLAPASLVAAIDIGSNAMRLRIGGLDADGQTKLVYYQREAVRLGKDSFTTGVLSEATMALAMTAFEHFRDAIDRYPVACIRATGTSALRSASNSALLIERIAQQTDIRIELISGEEEARLVHTAIQYAMPDFNQKKALSIDIGGGSVEVSLSDQGDIVALESFKMGTVRLLERFSNARNEAALARLVEEYATFMQRKVKEEILDAEVDFCIGTGGNIECIGSLAVDLLKTDSATDMSYHDLKQLEKILRSMDYQQRVDELGLRPDRADVIIPALLVLKSVMALVKPARLLIPCTGLAEGVLIDLLRREQGTSKKALRRQAVSWAIAMGRRFHVDLNHAQHVSHLARILFDELAEEHGLSLRHRLLLRIAALVHEVGIVIRSDGHHHHAAYILRATPMIGLTEEEKNWLAVIVRFQRKKMPSKSNDFYASLPDHQQRQLDALVLLLRLSMAMNKERNGDVQSIIVSTQHQQLLVQICGTGDLLLETWAAQKQAVHAEAVFGQAMVIEAVATHG
ncbi:MAG: Ppx/GppA phosphatase family protein [Mariprofundaceae bacterium]|nr:Ppx/GppA phosphatase family protein [Mariprofundaceae bacterium]